MKKLIALLLTLVLVLGIAAPALADASEVYSNCEAAYQSHLPANDHYACVRLDKVVTIDRLGRVTTTYKTVQITSDAGFVSKVLISSGMLDKVKTRAELKNMTIPASVVQDGALLFLTQSGMLKLVGLYANGYQFYIKNNYVVKEPYNAQAWTDVRVLNGV